jgi:hypothetical protein
MNWQAVHFFRQPGGLSRNEPKEMAACLDYEQALESKAIVELICSLPPAEKEWMLDRALRLPSRFTFLRSGSDHASRNLGAFEEVARFPPIPAACVAASWFPKHWLEAPALERKSVVEKIASIYPIHRLTIIDFPLDADAAELLTKSAAAEPNTTLHVIAINRTETRSALLQRFKAWLDKQEIEGTMSRKGKVNIPASLDDLACYRLSKLDAVSRETAMSEIGFRRSVARLSDAKRRAMKRLRERNYI